MIPLEAVLPPDDRDLLAGDPVDALVARVYDDLDELRRQVDRAEHQADLAEARLDRQLAADGGPTTGSTVPDTVDSCAATVRAHLARALDAAGVQADAIVAEARQRAEQLVLEARAEVGRPRPPARDRPTAAGPPVAGPTAVAPVDDAPAVAVPAARVAPVAAPRGPAGGGQDPPTAPADGPPAGGGTPVLGSTAGEAVFARFWAEADAGAALGPPRLRVDAEVLVLALAAAVMAVLLLVVL